MRLLRRSAVFALALTACEEEETTSTPDPTREFAVAVAEIVCEKAEPCCAQFALPEITEACHLQMRNEVFISFIEAKADGRVIDLAAGDECIARFEASASCEELRFPFELLDVCPELFSDIPEGALPPGSPCAGVFECASPEEGKRFCVVDQDAEPSCLWLIPMVEGEECSPGGGVYGDCGDSLVCGFDQETNAAPHVCRAPSLGGEACTTTGTCVDGYVCLPGETGNVCREALALGEPCLDEPDLCDFPNVCDVVDGVCAPLPIVATCEDAICSSELIEVCQ